EYWTHPPFAADRVPTEDGDFRIYARGSQDMKVTGSMYLEAIRKIKSSGLKLKRTVFIVFAPDEEIGGKDGVMKFVETEEFRSMNVGFDVDEGPIRSLDKTLFFYSERTINQVVFTAHGNTGHGSQFIEGTAIEKLLPVINEMMNLRKSEKTKLDVFQGDERVIKLGEFTSVNLTILKGGKQANVVPSTFSATFDIRVTPLIDLEEFRKFLTDLAEKNGVEFKIIHPEEKSTITKIDRSNIFISTFLNTLESKKIDYVPIISAGGTDARYIRPKGIPAFGFNPITNTPNLAHNHDEYIIESKYLNGIDIYVDLVENLANC
ncbi:Aminoacylase-1, partial [Smittium culicis]